MPGIRTKPTPEQEAAVEAFLSREDLKLVAVAGSGKTTTLRLMAEARPRDRLLYLAFNRAVRDEARKRMPRHVEVHTLHSLVYGEMVRRNPYLRAKFEAGRGQVRAYHIREALDLSVVDAYAVKGTLDNFLRSSLAHPQPDMVPTGYRDALRLKARGRYDEVIQAILTATQHLWTRMQDPHDPFPLSHDGYVKLWASNGAATPSVEALLVDEAQDLSPVFSDALEKQNGTQRVYVGDPNQQIYAWRGAVNAMSSLGGREGYLSWSFRFGEDLASVVRAFMGQVGRTLSLQGKAPWATRVVTFERAHTPVAVLCRTNVGVVQAATALEVSRLHIQGGVEEIVHLLEDAEALRQGAPRSNPHPDLVVLETWEDLVVLAEEVKDPSAAILLRLEQKHGDLSFLADRLRRAHTPRAEDAPVVLSTAHKAKGREWKRVVLWNDFPAVWRKEDRQAYMEAGKDLHEEENLLYVALTRAMEELHLSPPLDELLALGEGAVDAPTALRIFLEDLVRRDDIPEDVRLQASALLESLG